MSANRYQSTLLRCSHCNARGAVTWEFSQDGMRRDLIRISGDFHVESGRTVPDLRVIVCNQCDQIHGEALAVR